MKIEVDHLLRVQLINKSHRIIMQQTSRKLHTLIKRTIQFNNLLLKSLALARLLRTKMQQKGLSQMILLNMIF